MTVEGIFLKKQRILLLGSAITVMFIVIMAFAVQLNWYQGANVTGTIQPSALSLSSANLDFGTLSAGSNFQVSDNASASIPSNVNGGLNISNIILAISTVTTTTDAKSYLQERFSDLYLNITLNSITYEIGIVVDAVFNHASGLNYWSYLDTNYTTSQVYYELVNWNVVFIPSGNYNIPFTLFGTAGNPSTQLTTDLAIFLELS